MRWEQTFSGTAEEWEAEQERTVCRKQPSPRSTARCEMPKGHDLPVLSSGFAGRGEVLASFHAGRTRRGYWKFWPVEKA